MAMKVLLADDHRLLLQGVKSMLQQDGYEIVAEACDGRDAVRLARTLKPQIAVLDITIPGLNGLDAALRIRKYSPETKIVILTMHNESPYVIEALRAGVNAYVLKSQAAQDLLDAMRAVASNDVYLSPGISQIVVDAYRSKNRPDDDPLTLREREVLQLIAEGYRTKEVANVLSIGVKTAESHRGRIMSKLGIHDTAGLVRYAIRRGLIAP